MRGDIINKVVLDEVDSAIAELASEWRESNAILLTEFDLQAQLFVKLSGLPSLKGTFTSHNNGPKTVKIHGELSWYDEYDNHLTIVPDITILDPEGLSITENLFDEGERLPSKACSFLGEAIIFEIKFNRKDIRFDNNWIKYIQDDSKKIKTLVDKFADPANVNKIYAYQILFDRSQDNENLAIYKNASNLIANYKNVKCIYGNYHKLEVLNQEAKDESEI